MSRLSSVSLLVLLATFSLAPRAFALPAWETAEPEHRPPAVQNSPSWESGSDEAQPGSVETVPEATDAPARGPIIPEGASELDTRMAVLDTYLAEIQRPVRMHYFGWMAFQGGVIGLYAYMAATSDGAVRTASIIRASVASSNLGLMIITRQPGWYASSRYREMPAGSDDEKRAKLDAGQKWLARQAHVDKLATSPARHLLGAVVALGAGAGVLIAHDDGMREALTLTIGILLVSELQIATRPRKPRLYNQNYAAAPQGPVQLTVAPLVTQHAQGLALVGQF